MLFEIGKTVKEVGDLICGGNYGWSYNIHKAWKEKLNGSATFDPRFGIEIEAYNIPRVTLSGALREAGLSNWTVKSDGSLHGINAFELVSPVLSGVEGMEQVKRVCEVLERLNGRVDRSCGLHVHLEARTFTIDTWKRVYKNYLRLESAIDSIMPRSRRGNTNQYCRSIGNESNIRRIDTATTVAELVERVGDGTRYCKVNGRAFAAHGTIEFRQHSGTVEYRKISNWVKFLKALVSVSMQREVNDFNFLSDEIKSYINERKEELA